MAITLCKAVEKCIGGNRRGAGGGDMLMWHMDLKPHVSGDFSIAVVQANSSLEDQSQVFTSPSATYVGVYDGHGGPEASRFVNSHLFPYLQRSRVPVPDSESGLLCFPQPLDLLQFKFNNRSNGYGKQSNPDSESEFATDQGGISTEVIKKAFNATEEKFTRLVKQSLPFHPQIASVGSCCLFGAITDDVLYVANLGDSRAVLGRTVFEGNKNKVVSERLSRDHNVACEDVRKEVEALHPDDSAVVISCRGVWRIKGIIQVSRSIGDVFLKKPEFDRDPIFRQFSVPLKRPVLSAEPSVHIRDLKPEDAFLIFASDGLWEHLSDEAAVEIVFKNPRAGIAKKLVGAALQEAARKREMTYKDIRKIGKGARRHFHDDITVIVIYLDHKKEVVNGRFRHNAAGYTSTPMDIFSNADADL